MQAVKNEQVRARVILQPEWGQRTLLMEGPGTMWPLAKRMGPSEDERWNVCCPGCGTKVYNLAAHPILVELEGKRYIEPGYTFTGDVLHVDTISIAEVVEFVPCGCGPYRLTNGW